MSNIYRLCAVIFILLENLLRCENHKVNEENAKGWIINDFGLAEVFITLALIKCHEKLTETQVSLLQSLQLTKILCNSFYIAPHFCLA